MPNPDMITQYLASRGAAPSAENASRVRAHFGANPDMLDRRALGLPGGLDDNSSVLDAMLDKHVVESMPPIPQGSVEVGPVEQVPPPSRTGPRVKGAGEVGGTNVAKVGASRQAGYGPGPSPQRQMNYGGDEPRNSRVEGSNFTEGVGTGVQVGDTQRSDLTSWLLGLLGAGSMGALGYAVNKRAGQANAAAPTGPLPGSIPPLATSPQNAKGQAVPTDANGWPQGTGSFTDTTDPAVMRRRMEAEIAAENDAMQRQMEQDALKQRNQRNTEDLARAARRAIGRR